MHRWVYTSWFLGALSCASVAGCHLIAGLDDLERATTDGQGGDGSTTTSTGGGGSTATAGGGSTTTSEGGGGSTTTSEGGGGSTTTSDGGGGSTTTTTSSCMGACELGDSCSVPADCKSGYCIDGVCCDSSCTGKCDACSKFKKKGGANGVCGPILAGNNPDADCPLGEACDGQGGCKLANGQGCADGTPCATGYCADGVCCDTDCSGPCRSCNPAGQLGTCTPYLAGDDPENECNGVTPDDACNGAGVCGAGAQGEACSTDAGCATKHCVDGFCCNTACGAPDFCVACRMDWTGSLNGTCAAVTANTDPKDECAGAKVCLGNNMCSN